MSELNRLETIFEIIRGTELEGIFALVALGAFSGTCAAMADAPTSEDYAVALARIEQLIADGFMEPELLMQSAGTGEA